MIDLVKKYDVPVPRYTSYPTVPAWDVNAFQLEEYKGRLKASFQQTKEEGISLYLHLPYCESLCTYCGCNTRITINHKVELPYIESLLKEWKLYLALFGKKPLVREIHLGGGTPTFFSPENLRYLMESILDSIDVHPDYQFSFEGHPNNTTYEHLVALYEVGFTRVSYGVQDVDFKVQKAINRLQPLENIEKVTKAAREIGYTSVNFDLIYGLPFQTIYGIKQTMDVVKRFKPDRIAFYSYAHVPWVKPGQRAYSEEHIPQGEEKYKLNMLGQALLVDMGYESIGIDHFALPEDPLCQARSKGRLHRNFMGYTESRTNFMIGLGVSSISDIGVAYAQNVKSVEGYRAKVEAGEFPIFKGHLMTVPEMEAKQLILDIACSARIQMRDVLELSSEKYTAFNQMVEEGLIEKFCLNYQVTSKGMMFLRNICALFDAYYEPENGSKLFSKAV
tara:strand:+ start:4937 stop:6280 length:1344 start_codon:yes stop_codon:yes gene_type:complete